MQQTQNPSQQQPILQTPPPVITTKDHAYLKDQLSWLLLAAKKCRHFAQECTDPQIAQAIDQAGQMHQRHYMMLIKHLQNDNTAAMQAVRANQQ